MLKEPKAPSSNPGEVKSGRTHGLERAVAGQPKGVQRLGTVHARRDHLVQEVAGVLIMTGAQLVHTRDLHPETGHLLLQGQVHLVRRRRRRSKEEEGPSDQVNEEYMKTTGRKQLMEEGKTPFTKPFFSWFKRK